MHRTVLNMVRCMVFASGLPLQFWDYVVQSATYVLNRNPSSANPKRMSPLEMLTGEIPSISDIVVLAARAPFTATLAREIGNLGLISV